MRQLKLPLEIEKLIDISDPVYTFCEVIDHIDLSRYFVEKGYKTGHPRCDAQKLLKVILFAFMENGICSLREIEKLCRNDIRYMYLLDGMKTPSFATFENLIHISDPVYTFCVQCIDIDPMLCTIDGKIQSHIWSLSEISGC